MGLIKWLKETLILAVVFTAFFSYAGFVRTDDNIDDLKLIIEKKNEDIKKLEEEAQKYRQEIVSKAEMGSTLKAELSRVEKTIVQIRRDINLTSKRIQKTELEIKETELEIQQKEKAVQKLRSGLAGLVQVLLEKERESPFIIIVKHKILSDFFQQLDHDQIMQQRILSSVSILRSTKNELEVKKIEAQDKKNKLEGLKRLSRGRQEIQEDIQRGKKELLVETKNQEKKYRELLREQEKKREALEEELREIEAKLQITIDQSLLPLRGSRVLGWPLPDISLISCFGSFAELKNCITQFFGYTSFAAVGGYNGKGHNGIDFRAAVGTPVLAAGGGIVEGVGDTDTGCRRASYGKWVLLKHPNNLSTIYAHLSLVHVRAGQEIENGETIGLSGQSGYATGPHLHLGVFAAQAVKIESIRSRVCGRLMILPISPPEGYLNPLDYL